MALPFSVTPCMCVSPSQHILPQKYCAKSALLQSALKKDGFKKKKKKRRMYSRSDISEVSLSGVTTLLRLQVNQWETC